MRLHQVKSPSEGGRKRQESVGDEVCEMFCCMSRNQKTGPSDDEVRLGRGNEKQLTGRLQEVQHRRDRRGCRLGTKARRARGMLACVSHMAQQHVGQEGEWQLTYPPGCWPPGGGYWPPCGGPAAASLDAS